MKIIPNQNLKNLNTLGLNVTCKFYAVPSSKKELIDLLLDKHFLQEKKMIIGSGSNILFKSDFQGLLIHPAMMEIKISDVERESVYLKVGAGVNWDKFVEFTVDRGWGGLENLSWIPGCVGASPIQNIGAYGTEAKDSIVKVEYVDIESASEFTLSANECRFGYRDSIFKQELKSKVVITSVTFKLSKFPKVNSNYADVSEALKEYTNPTLHNLRQIIIDIRKKKLPDPAEVGNVGSFFKNPVVPEETAKVIQLDNPTLKIFPAESGFCKIPAAWLIEQCGFKGKRIGNVGVHSNQALVLLAYEGAKGQELLELSTFIMNAVKDKFGIDIEPEVNIC